MKKSILLKYNLFIYCLVILKKLKNLQEQLRKVKDENKSLSEQLQENEKNLRLAHEKLIKKEEKIKEIQTKIKDKKQNQGKGEEEPEVIIQ